MQEDIRALFELERMSNMGGWEKCYRRDSLQLCSSGLQVTKGQEDKRSTRERVAMVAMRERGCTGIW